MQIINTYDIKDNFKNVSIVVNTTNIEIKNSEKDETKVICKERKKYAHNVHIEDETLIIRKKERKWYTYILPNFDKADITIFIPKDKTENINIKCNTGHINISSINFKDNVNIKINTGKINLDKVLVKGKISIKTNTGKVNFNDSDANELFIKTNTGNVGGTLLTDKAFVIRCNTGRINIPTTFGNNKCEIISNTGNIDFKTKA